MTDYGRHEGQLIHAKFYDARRTLRAVAVYPAALGTVV
jgi:hypothetical protein